MPRLLSLMLVLSLALTLLASAALAGAAGPSPLARWQTAVRGALKKTSFHYAGTTKDALGTITVSADVGRSGGVQHFTIDSGGLTGHVTVLNVGGAAFIKGDTLALERFMGFAPSEAQRLAGRWVRVAESSSHYQPVVADTTVPNVVVDQMGLPQPLRASAPTTVDSQRVVGIHATLKSQSLTVSAVLYVQAAGAGLPVAVVVHQGKSVATAHFSRWNESLHLVAPQAALTIR